MRYIKEADGRIYVECEICGQIMKLRKELVKDNGSLQEEVECFCGTRDRIINGLPQKNNMINVVNVPTRIVNNHVPKCPTCGSERVSKITLTSKWLVVQCGDCLVVMFVKAINVIIVDISGEGYGVF